MVQNKGTVFVYFKDDDYTSNELSLLDHEYNLPKVNDEVFCLFTSDGDGICLNGFYRESNKPTSADKYSHYKMYGDNAFIGIERATGDLVISGAKVRFIGNLVVQGNLEVTGSITSETGGA